jgi:hypothetical protein
MKSNEEAYKGIVKEKDSQISEYKRKYKSAKVQQYAGYGFGVVAVVVGLVLGF